MFSIIKNNLTKLDRNYYGKIFLIVLFIFIISASTLIYIYLNNLKPVTRENGHSTIIIRIPKGASSYQISNILKNNGLIKNEFAFRFYTKINKYDSKLQAGNYELNNSMSAEEIVKKIAKGEVIEDYIRLTIPEGLEIKEIAKIIENYDIGNSKKFKELAIVDNYREFNFLYDLEANTSLEGYLFPDTYFVKPDIEPSRLINIMLKRFETVFYSFYKEHEKLNIHEIVTLASIIEREAMLKEEMPIVGSVFHNRLERGMRLESCATVQYILEERKPVLLYKDTEIESPYNTYQNIGLPPGPIASPGKNAIKSAIYPENTDYLFFVAQGDGSHVFTKSFREHINARPR